MENEVEGRIGKGQRFGHIRSNDLNGITFPLCNQPFAFQLFGRIVQHGAVCTHRRKDWHLLTTAGSKTQHFLTL